MEPMILRTLVIPAFSLILAAGAYGQSPDTLRLLFIGNSHTYYNNMPWLVDSLAMSAGKTAIVDMSAFGNYTLEAHRSNAQTLGKIDHGPWDHIILQEYSTYPVIYNARWNHWHPACWSFDTLIRSHGAITTLFMTWGWKNGGRFYEWGDSSIYFVDYFHMQDSVTSAYEWLAWDINRDTLVPVGRAWALARTIDSLVDLWESDNSHATLKGSYLTACVFYTKLFRANPIGLPYTAGLTPGDALFLQTVAYETIYGVAEAPITVPVTKVLTANPNPFRNDIRFTIHDPRCMDKDFSLIIYDASGRLVKDLSSGLVSCGMDHVSWNGRSIPPGIYFIQLQTGDKTETAKIVRLK
jgi:hypothetical protein